MQMFFRITVLVTFINSVSEAIESCFSSGDNCMYGNPLWVTELEAQALNVLNVLDYEVISVLLLNVFVKKNCIDQTVTNLQPILMQIWLCSP